MNRIGESNDYQRTSCRTRMQHKALEHEIAEALGQSSIDDLKIKELKRRKLMLKDEIERLRHDHTL